MSTAKTDRQTTTPFLLKLFYRTSFSHNPSEFLPHLPTPPHLQIYTWQTCTLRELTHLVASVPSLLPSPAIGTRLVFKLIFPDTRPPGGAGRGGGPGGGREEARYITKELGSVVVGGGGPGIKGDDRDTEMQDGDAAGGGELDDLSGDAEKTLESARFVIGDYVSCAIYPPLPNGDVAPAVPAAGFRAGRGGEYAAPRGGGMNGFGGRGGRGGPRQFEGGRGSIPSGEWRRGERLPDTGYGRGRGGRGRGW
ncbi:hypothetical protein M501DRAFT_1028474 [Patellaria atrata CBS 101060]|uniref:Sin3-associated polypeptide Sap18 n=1 Tax=Patellaria atrata CBS 101060 TaxID=1346257 RepID=A0A9P4VXD5_9PEZI|nr:hypothetical protein M501DRAFT_1028474 [Patellaria atrata CBS 101060]